MGDRVHFWPFEGWAIPEGMSVIAEVARLLRKEDLDASSAHIIEAVRLAEALAALRQRPIPGLLEMNDAAQTVFCFGNDLPLQLIHTKLIVGETLGRVPAAAPMPPLPRDLKHEQKRLRLPPDVTQRALDLDLRQPLDLDRSRLLHRLRLLNLPWGAVQRTGQQIVLHGPDHVVHQFGAVAEHGQVAGRAAVEGGEFAA